ncbi:MAG: FHA domain-containing protein, partial [Chloroflexi bacterium]|nr:FHA domain-containing protein [Chloroflexota bacterium]
MRNLQTEQALLIWKEGDLIKDQWILNDSAQEITIGRSADCVVSIPVRWISRMHAVLRRQGGQFVLEDSGSKNGVFVNGQRVIKPRPLNDGDVIPLSVTFVEGITFAELRAQLEITPGIRVTLKGLPGKVYSRAEVIEAAWPGEAAEGVSDDAIDALVRRLRQRLAEIDLEYEFIV